MIVVTPIGYGAESGAASERAPLISVTPTLSVAVAVPGSTVAVALPASVSRVTLAGAVTTGAVSSTTVTVWVADVLPPGDVAVHVIVVTPSGNELPAGTPEEPIVAPALVVVAVPSCALVTTAHAHVDPGPVPVVTFGGAVMFGGRAPAPHRD